MVMLLTMLLSVIERNSSLMIIEMNGYLSIENRTDILRTEFININATKTKLENSLKTIEAIKK